MALQFNNAHGNWVSLTTSITNDLYGVHFIHADNGIVVGNGGIFETTNGGTNWAASAMASANDSALLQNCILYDVFELSGHWFAVGKDITNGNGIIFSKPPSGAWGLSYTHSGAGLNAISARGSDLLAVGDQGTILHSANNGGAWTALASGISARLTSVAAYASISWSSTYIGGDTTLLYGSDFLNTGWTRVRDSDVLGLLPKNNGGALFVNTNEIYEGHIFNWQREYNYTAPLNATCISSLANNEIFIGTNNGILRSNTGSNNDRYWEVMVSAVGFDINDIFMVGVHIGYAVGDGGLLLKATNYGGAALPYIAYQSTGACVDSVLNFVNYGPEVTPSYNYQWKINNVQVSTQHTPSATYTSPGLYQVNLVVNNGSATDSLQQTFYVVNPPDTAKTYSVSDTLLCHVGTSDITVHNTDTGIVYRLLALPGLNPVATGIGNGGDVVLYSGTLTDSTRFVVGVKSPIADCEVTLADTILIGVEHTEALFHVEYVNAELNENFTIFNNSRQASTFYWSFDTGASGLTSTAFEPTLSYNSLGLKTTTLIAESQYGCRDTLMDTGPYVYSSQGLPEHCWGLNFDGDYVSIYEHDDVEEIVALSNGDIIAAGNFSDTEFLTKTGITKGRHIGNGFFIARYSNKGVLKWMVKGTDQFLSTNPLALGNYTLVGSAFDLEIDDEDNIYVTGWIDEEFLFYNNDGNVIPMARYRDGFVFKLDQHGRLKWHTGMKGVVGQHLARDGQGNLYVAGRVVNRWQPKIFHADSGHISLPVGRFVLIKMDTLGHALWATGIESSIQSPQLELTDMDADDQGNAYLVGNYRSSLLFNSATGAGVPLTYTNGTGSDGFLAKYNTSGQAVWAHGITTENPQGWPHFDRANNVAVSNQGDVYIGINGNANSVGQNMFFPSTSGTVDSLFGGPYTLAKYNSAGIYQWGLSENYVYTSRIGEITLDDFGYVYTIARIGTQLTNNPVVLFGTDSTQLSINVTANQSYIVKYDQLGHVLSMFEPMESYPIPSYGTEKAVIGIDHQQNILYGGTTSWNTSSVGIIGNDTLVAERSDGFIARFSSSGCQSDSISVLTSGIAYCEGSTFDFPFFLGQGVVVGMGNVFELELSDSTGNFANPVVIGSLNSTNAVDTIMGTIPFGGLGAGYLLRITASNPALTSTGTPIFIGPPAIAQLDSFTICPGDTIALIASIGAQYTWNSGTFLTDTVSQTTHAFPDSSMWFTVAVNTPCELLNDSFYVEVLWPDTTILSSLSICQGDSMLIFGAYQDTAGSYMDTLQASTGCDSVLIQPLQINPVYSTLLPDVVICQGDSALIFGNVRHTPGIYYDTLQTIHGCDSIFVQSLSLNSVYATVLPDVEICQGDSALLFGNYQYQAGTYQDTLTAVNGCDSVLSQGLIVHPHLTNNLPVISLCQGDSTSIFGSFRSTSGLYFDTLNTVYGCDSILIQELSVDSVLNVSLPGVSICLGDSVLLFGSYQSLPGSYYDTLTSTFGCDSIVEVNLVVNQPATTTLSSQHICTSDSLLIFGNYQQQAGWYYDTLQTTAGCDSIVAQKLLVDSLPLVQLNPFQPDTICIQTAPMTLPVGMPSGGTYNGAGVVGNTFDPIVAGTGSHWITYFYIDSNQCSGSDSTQVVVEICPGYEELNAVQSIQVLPNPTRGKVFLSQTGLGASNSWQVKIYSSNGQLMQQAMMKQHVSDMKFDLSAYPDGIYFLILFGEEQVERYPLVKSEK